MAPVSSLVGELTLRLQSTQGQTLDGLRGDMVQADNVSKDERLLLPIEPMRIGAALTLHQSPWSASRG